MGAVVAHGFDELDFTLAHRQEGDSHPLPLLNLGVGEFEPKVCGVELQSLLNAVDSDSDVVNSRNHVVFSLAAASCCRASSSPFRKTLGPCNTLIRKLLRL